MELVNKTAYDQNQGEYEVEVPANRIVKRALLELDYSQGAISIPDAMRKLANRFCLSEDQINARDSGGRRILSQQVHVAVEELVRAKNLVRTKPATIITAEALMGMVANFFENLCYEPIEVEVVENQGDSPFHAHIDVGTQHLKFSAARESENASTNA